MDGSLDQFTSLVFEGGGVKGIAYCGATKYFEWFENPGDREEPLNKIK